MKLIFNTIIAKKKILTTLINSFQFRCLFLLILCGGCNDSISTDEHASNKSLEKNTIVLDSITPVTLNRYADITDTFQFEKSVHTEFKNLDIDLLYTREYNEVVVVGKVKHYIDNEIYLIVNDSSILPIGHWSKYHRELKIDDVNELAREILSLNKNDATLTMHLQLNNRISTISLVTLIKSISNLSTGDLKIHVKAKEGGKYKDIEPEDYPPLESTSPEANMNQE